MALLPNVVSGVATRRTWSRHHDPWVETHGYHQASLRDAGRSCAGTVRGLKPTATIKASLRDETIVACDRQWLDMVRGLKPTATIKASLRDRGFMGRQASPRDEVSRGVKHPERLLPRLAEAEDGQHQGQADGADDRPIRLIMIGSIMLVVVFSDVSTSWS